MNTVPYDKDVWDAIAVSLTAHGRATRREEAKRLGLSLMYHAALPARETFVINRELTRVRETPS